MQLSKEQLQLAQFLNYKLWRQSAILIADKNKKTNAVIDESINKSINKPINNFIDNTTNNSIIYDCIQYLSDAAPQLNDVANNNLENWQSLSTIIADELANDERQAIVFSAQQFEIKAFRNVVLCDDKRWAMRIFLSPLVLNTNGLSLWMSNVEKDFLLHALISCHCNLLAQQLSEIFKKLEDFLSTIDERSIALPHYYVNNNLDNEKDEREKIILFCSPVVASNYFNNNELAIDFSLGIKTLTIAKQLIRYCILPHPYTMLHSARQKEFFWRQIMALRQSRLINN